MILLLAAFLATGTIVESRFSTPVAKRFVYGTWWFAAFLILLAVNLFCSALSRFPWKKYQTGFVLTHLGIICILAGSLITQQMGVDGQIGLNEGEEGNVFQEDKPTIYYQPADSEPVSIALPYREPDPDHPLIVHMAQGGMLMVDQFYLNAQKKVRGRAPLQGEKGSSAVHINLDSSFVHENQWLFLGNPQYGQLDLGPASAYFMVESDWKKRLAGGAKDVPPNALAVLLTPDGTLKFQTRFRGQFRPAQAVEIGKDYSTGWMDMQFKVEQRMAQALPDETFEPLPLESQKEPVSAIHYQILDGQDKKEGWLGYQSQVSVSTGGKKLELAYGPRHIDLPFAIHLVKFKLGFDPGTQKPASYASDIFYIDPRKGTQVPATISMNEPLHFMGYTVYQASFQPLPDGKYLSVFSVGQDPGLWLKYGGAIILVSGIIFMFWFKNPAWIKKEQNAG